MYINPATLKKFIELIKTKKVDEKSISLPIKPMYTAVYLNPQMTVGIRGLRHIQKAGGLSALPVIYVKKEHVSRNWQHRKSHLQKAFFFPVQQKQSTVFHKNNEDPSTIERAGGNNKGLHGIFFWHQEKTASYSTMKQNDYHVYILNPTLPFPVGSLV